MKILLATQFFYPDIQATSLLFSMLCEDLAQDHKVTVVCGPPLIEAPGEKNDKSRCKIIHKNIRIVRLFSTRRIKKSLADRAINHISFILSSFTYMIVNPVMRSRHDIFLYSSDNPLSFINALLFMKKPKIYLCQDLYLEQGLSIGFFKKGLIPLLLGFCQKLAFRFSDKIIVIGDKIKQYLEETGVPSEKIEVIPGWVDTKNIMPCDQNNPFSDKLHLKNKFVVMHSGRIGLTQDLELLLDCARSMRKDTNITFVIIGEGVNKNKLVEIARNKSLNNVLFLPYQPQSLLRYSLATASVGVILSKGALSHCLVPSRLYSIMASQRPVIATADEDGDVFNIISRSKCGTVIKKGDPDSLKEAIYSIYYDRQKIKALGERGRSFVETHFNRPQITVKYNEIIKQVYGK